MIEVKGDIFSFKDVDALCFTSNGILNSKKENVMGAGVAKVFRDRISGLARDVGTHISLKGNVVGVCRNYSETIDGKIRTISVLNFPTKHHWKDPSDLKLIEKSATDLVALTNKKGWKKVYVPFPGVGFGALSKSQVRPVLEKLWDERFYVVSL